MSLIQEALKRQEMEAAEAGNTQQGDNAGQQIPSAPPGTPPDPASAAAPAASDQEPESSEVPAGVVIEKAEKGSKSKVLASVAGIVFVLVLAVGAAVYLLSLAVSRKTVTPDASGQQESADESAAAPGDTAPPAVVEAPPAPTKPASTPVAMSVVHEPEQEAAPIKPPPALPAEKPLDPGVVASAAKVDAKPNPPKLEKPVVKKEPEPVDLPPVQWPRLKLTAVLCGLDDDQDAARINGVMVPEGGQIDGVTVKEVQQEGVMLQLEHETKFLRMGASSD